MRKYILHFRAVWLLALLVFFADTTLISAHVFFHHRDTEPASRADDDGIESLSLNCAGGCGDPHHHRTPDHSTHDDHACLVCDSGVSRDLAHAQASSVDLAGTSSFHPARQAFAISKFTGFGFHSRAPPACL